MVRSNTLGGSGHCHLYEISADARCVLLCCTHSCWMCTSCVLRTDSSAAYCIFSTGYASGSSRMAFLPKQALYDLQLEYSQLHTCITVLENLDSCEKSTTRPAHSIQCFSSLCEINSNGHNPFIQATDHPISLFHHLWRLSDI